MDLLVRSPDGCPGNRSRRNLLRGVAGRGWARRGIWQGMDTPDRGGETVANTASPPLRGKTEPTAQAHPPTPKKRRHKPGRPSLPGSWQGSPSPQNGSQPFALCWLTILRPDWDGFGFGSARNPLRGVSPPRRAGGNRILWLFARVTAADTPFRWGLGRPPTAATRPMVSPASAVPFVWVSAGGVEAAVVGRVVDG